jgi:hypothetical protein
MRLRLWIHGFDFSDVALIESMTVRQDSREAISTANITLFRKYGESLYDHARYDRASFTFSWVVNEWQDVLVWDQDTTKVLFGGVILAIERQTEGPHVRMNLQCSDWGILFERTLVTQSWANGTPDSTVVQDLVRLTPPLSNGTIVTRFTQLGLIEAKDQRIRDVLDNLCSLTGAEWNVSYDGKVNYYTSGSIVAPFGLSDEPDGTTTMPYMLEDVRSDFADAANRILVLGGVGEDGNEIRAEAFDMASENTYGPLALTLVDRNIQDPLTAGMWAQSEVAVRAQPKPTVRASVFAPGLSRGMTVFVEAHKYGIRHDLILRSLEIVITAPDRTRTPVAGHKLKYTAELGWRPPDLIYTLRRMQRVPIERTEAPAVEIPPGSITPPSLAAGLEMIHVVSTLPNLPDAAYSATAIALWTGAPGGPQLYRRTGITWTAYLDAADISGQLDTPQLKPGSVTSTVLADNSVVTAKIPEGAIKAPQLSASSVTANAIAANAIYAEAMQANSVTSLAIKANAVTAGKIDALAVVAGNLAANAVTAGTIAAGAVSAGEIAAGAITTDKLAANSVTAEKILAGTITSKQLTTGEISVGVGPDMPGTIWLYGGTQGAAARVAMMGNLSTIGAPAGANIYGIWGKVIAAGGTNYADAPLKTDANGNLLIRDAYFQLFTGPASPVNNGPPRYSIEMTPTTFDPTYSSLTIRVAELGQTTARGPYFDNTYLIPRGVVIQSAGPLGTRTVAALVRHPTQPNYAQLVLNNPEAGTLILFDGYTQQVRADGGFGVSGQSGQTETVVISGTTLKFRGGIYVGH